ncbi:MAG: c-type cytochrome [Dehalococcoidia bacterium]|nr:c-type cytochrome [Dehalococcoidia bacterium]
MNLKRLTISACAFAAIGLLACTGNPGTVPPAPTPPAPTAVGAASTATAGAAQAQPTATTAAAAQPSATTAASAQPTQTAASGGGAGNADTGKILVSSKGCIACHTIQSIPAARGTIGPDLSTIASRDKLSVGNLSFNDADLRKWLTNPPGVKADTLMPNLGLAAGEVDNLIAYLKTLK